VTFPNLTTHANLEKVGHALRFSNRKKRRGSNSTSSTSSVTNVTSTLGGTTVDEVEISYPDSIITSFPPSGPVCSGAETHPPVNKIESSPVNFSTPAPLPAEENLYFPAMPPPVGTPKTNHHHQHGRSASSEVSAFVEEAQNTYPLVANTGTSKTDVALLGPSCEPDKLVYRHNPAYSVSEELWNLMQDSISDWDLPVGLQQPESHQYRA
jgi:hypothetical protein